MKNLTFFFLLFMGTLSLNAQSEETLFNSSGLKISGVWGSATYNFSSFGEDWTLIRGGYGGLEFSRDVFIGWGGYETREHIQFEDNNQEVNLRYNGLVVGIAPNSIKAIHPRITFLTGSGKVWSPENNNKDRILVFQPSAGVEFNIFQWFRLGFEGGYRFAGAATDLNLSKGDLSTPFAQIELRFGLSWRR